MLGLRKKRVAITGGLACGKSSVARIFSSCGAFVVSADTLVHSLLVPDTSLGQQIVCLLGHDVVIQDHFDRRKIAQKVFGDRLLLDRYEKLLHPAVRALLKKALDEHEASCASPLLCAEVPLLYEAGMDADFDYVIAVSAPKERCIERFCKQGYTASDFDLRQQRMLAASDLEKRADLTLKNDGSLTDLEEKALAAYTTLCHP